MQVEDDPRLLELMLQDIRSAGPMYQPTNYWAVYEKTFLPELRRRGLRNFASRRGSILSSFGGTDCFQRKIPLPFKLPREKRLEEFKSGVFDEVAALGRKFGARPIEALEISSAGNPKDLIRKQGRAYPASSLRYYLEYAYCCQFIDFDKISVLVELGSGAGKQVEVIKKLHPQITFLLFDIPPQLYVAEQYLKAVFPSAVLSYRQTREMGSLSGLPKAHQGKIGLFGNWKFPLLRELEFDLFWNAASFQEMEPDVVANYLSIADTQAKAVFLHQMMGGKEIAKKKGWHGVLRQTILEDYRKGLRSHALIDLSGGLLPFHGASGEAYQGSFWKRKTAPVVA